MPCNFTDPSRCPVCTPKAPAPIIPTELADRAHRLAEEMMAEVRQNQYLRSHELSTIHRWAMLTRDIELRLRSIPVVVPCPLCGQHITDGKPCGCGAR